MVDDLCRLTADALSARMRDGEITAEQLARACLVRIAAREADVRAWSYVDPDAVIRQARELDKLPSRGPLHGIPIGVKDIYNTADMPTQHNSPIYTGHRPNADAATVGTLRAAGALILGKTDTMEFASTGRLAATRNPHNLARTPGGSSSGSAAAVGDFHVPLALGTQTGGSLIRPASFCGVYAMKPTWNAVSAEGVKLISTTLDTVGWNRHSCPGVPIRAFDEKKSWAPKIAKPAGIVPDRLQRRRSKFGSHPGGWMTAASTSPSSIGRIASAGVNASPAHCD